MDNEQSEVLNNDGVDYEHLDDVFAADENYTERAVVLFAPDESDGALYLNGTLARIGPVRLLCVDALVLLGAHVITSDEFRLGHRDGVAASHLNEIDSYTEKAEAIEFLRAQAAELLSRAAALEDGSHQPGPSPTGPETQPTA